jgi:hypothetical protein
MAFVTTPLLAMAQATIPNLSVVIFPPFCHPAGAAIPVKEEDNTQVVVMVHPSSWQHCPGKLTKIPLQSLLFYCRQCRWRPHPPQLHDRHYKGMTRLPSSSVIITPHQRHPPTAFYRHHQPLLIVGYICANFGTFLLTITPPISINILPKRLLVCTSNP